MTADPQALNPALKAKHRKMWASGNYPEMAETFLTPLGPRLVEFCEIGPGERVLDIAAGTGNAAIPAAAAGASVVASDLTPELFEAGRARAADANAENEGRTAEFDQALSEFCAEWNRGGGEDARFEIEYLLTVGRRRS